MPALPLLPAARCGVVTLAELLAAGWTPAAVRHAVRTGRLERVAPSRFAPPPPDRLDRFGRADLRLLRRAIAATLPGDRVGVSHLAAALLRGWPVWADPPRACASTPDPRVRRATPGVHVHRLLDTTAFVRRAGVPVTSGARTIVDIAREFGTEAALVPADFAVRTGALTARQLADEVERGAGRSGIVHARPLLALLDPRAESPLESRSRWQFHVHGITPPESQAWISTTGGVRLGRVDHYWPEGVVGEADGELKYRDRDDRQALVNEKRRQQALEDLGLEVVRWGAGDLRDFRAAAARIERARARARSRVDADRRWRVAFTQDPRVHDPVVEPG